MMNMTVGESHKISIPNKWSELTIEQYAKIVSYIKLHDLGNKDETKSPVDDEKQILNNMKCSRDIFTFLTGMNENDVDRIDIEQMNTVIEEITKLLQTQNVLLDDLENKHVDVLTGFEWKGIKYEFPKLNMDETTFGDYIETQQLNVANAEHEAGRFGVMAEQMAILCKERNVKNTPDLIKKKTRLFEKIGMDVVWHFVFFLMGQTNSSMKNLEIYLKMATEMETDMQQKIGKL